MKRISLFLIITLFAAALFIMRQKETPASPSTELRSADQPQLTARRSMEKQKDFWEDAVVPDPGEHIPAKEIRPEDLGITVPKDRPHPSILLNRAIAEDNLPAIHSAILAWFAIDPQATRDWIAEQESLESLQPAIASIAQAIAESNDLPTAMEWANLLTDPTLRESALFDMQALALRARRITPEQIITDGLSPERVAELRSGAAGD